MADPLELELKLEFDPADRERLESARPLKSAHGETHRLVSTYFDTPARDLLKAGYSLRVRRIGRRRVQTVKAAGDPSAGLFVRPEWERPVKGDAPLLDGESGPLVQEIGAKKLDRIEPIFVTDVKRTTFRIDLAGAKIELAIDDGEVRAGGRAEPIAEVELELRGGSLESGARLCPRRRRGARGGEGGTDHARPQWRRRRCVSRDRAGLHSPFPSQRGVAHPVRERGIASSGAGGAAPAAVRLLALQAAAHR
jgi:hypothetical protein